METLQVGLIAGRHDMPVERYIFEEGVADVTDFDAIRDGVGSFLEKNCGIRLVRGCGVNAINNSSVWQGNVALEVYVTGLSAATAEVVRQCALFGVHLTLKHYDKATGNYLPQQIF